MISNIDERLVKNGHIVMGYLDSDIFIEKIKD